MHSFWPPIHHGRFHAEIKDDFVVILLGMRFNQIWAIHRWLPTVYWSMRMMNELKRNPPDGFLNSWNFAYWKGAGFIQYWKSFEHLESWARDKKRNHANGWSAYARRHGEGGSVGLWHETFLVSNGQYENIYTNMPLFGLATIGRHKEISKGSESSRERISLKKPSSI